MQKNRSFIRQFIINPKFQLSFIKIFILIGALQLTVQLIVIQIFKNNFSDLLLQIGQKQGDTLFIFLGKQTQFLTTTTIIISGLFLIFFAVSGLFLSQKIAGPIYKTMKFLKTAKPNEKLSYRKDDYFQDLAEAINESRK